MEITFLEILLTACESFILLSLLLLFSDLKNFIKENKIKSIIFIIMYVFIVNWPSTLFPFGMHTIFIIFFSGILFKIICNLNFTSAFLSTILSFSFFFPVELLITSVATSLCRIPTEDIFIPSYLRYFLGFLSKAIELLIILVLSKSKLKINKYTKFSKSNNIYSILILQLILLSLFIFAFYTIKSDLSNYSDFILYIPVIYGLFLGLTTLDIKERVRLQSLQHKLQAQEERIENLETIMNIIRREKHDFSNHLNTILALCVLNKPDALSKIESYIKKITSNLQSSYHMYNTGNDYVDGLLAVKSNIAFQKNITLDTDFECSLTDFNINDCDLTSILSNILDNAFDAILMSGDIDNKVISIHSFEEGNNKVLSVSNNGPVIPTQDIPKLFLNGYSSKSKSSGERGFGLYIVKDLVDKYGGEIVVNSNEEETEFLIIFKDVKNYGTISK